MNTFYVIMLANLHAPHPPLKDRQVGGSAEYASLKRGGGIVPQGGGGIGEGGNPAGTFQS